LEAGLTAYSGMNRSPNVNATSPYTWSCSGTTRSLSGNGNSDHPVSGGNFATPVGRQGIASTFPLTPVNTGTAAGSPSGPTRTPRTRSLLGRITFTLCRMA
jgi:hypothetical protein